MPNPSKRFVLKHTFEKVSEIGENGKLYSDEEEHFNVPWRVFIERKDGHLSIFLNCWKALDGAKWSVQTNLKLKLAAGEPTTASIEHTFGNEDGNRKYSSKGCPKFIEWEELKEKHLVGDKLTVEARVSIVKMTGFYAEDSMAFDDQNMKDLSDMEFAVGDKHFFVSKQFLSSQSSYFKEVFTVRHKNQDALKFTQIDSADFQKYLETLYGQSVVIDDANVEAVLLLATKFSTSSVIGKCEEFLTEKSQKSLEKKMQMADRYGCDRLKTYCTNITNTLEQDSNVSLNSTSSAVATQLVPAEETNTINQVTSNNIEIIDEVIEYGSPMASVDTASDVLNVSDQSGLKCTWSGILLHENGPIDFTWKFEWDDLKRRGVNGFTGLIDCQFSDTGESIQVEVDLKNPTQIVERVIANDRAVVLATFEFYLIPIYKQAVEKTLEDVKSESSSALVIDEAEVKSEKDDKSDSITSLDVLPDDVKPEDEKFEECTSEVTTEDMFLPSKKNDTVLVVEDKLLYVNKAYLSYHSDYFEHLFTENKANEEGQFEIEDVTYEDFSLLMSAVHPESAFPSENSFPKLAALADRFQMSTVIRQIENSILKGSQLEHSVVMGMADKYGMSRLLEKSIQMMDTAQKAKELIKSPGFFEMSLETKARLLERIADLL